MIITAFLLAVDVILGVVLVNISSRTTKEVLNHKMLELAQTAARLVNGSEIKMLTIDDEVNQTPAYVNNLNILAAFKTTSEEEGADLAFIYCMVKDESGKIVFSLDPSDEPGEFLVEEPINTRAMNEAFNGIAGVDDQPYEDRWGVLYSAYAPIYLDPVKKDEVVGVIGVDVWARWYEEQIKSNVLAITISSIVSTSLGVFLALLITMNIRKKFESITKEMGALESEVQVLLEEIKKNEGEEKDITPISSNGDTMATLKNQIITAQNEIKKYVAYAQEKAYYDPLTKLYNRQAYFERVKAINAKISGEEETNFLVIVYDVNSLKDINDTYGHEFGDIALVESAKVVSNIYGKDNSYRIGGDEFVVILDNVSKDKTEELHEQFNKKIDDYNHNSDELPVELSLSSGLCVFNKESHKEFLDVFREADKSMYKNKKIYHDKK